MSNDLTLEKLKINERLMDVERSMAEARPIREEILSSLNRIDKRIEILDHKINGNGKPGIEDRIKNIELMERIRKESHDNIIKIGIGAITALCITVLTWVGKLILLLLK